MEATYTKLKSGDWGVRVTGGAVTEGAVIAVRKKSGESKHETIARALWSSNGVTLCAIGASARGVRSGSVRSGSHGGRCRECRGPIRDAAHHRAMGGMCGECAFDEYDC